MSSRSSSNWKAALLFTGAAALFHPPVHADGDFEALKCVGKRDLYFSPMAIRLSQFGTVLVEYSVNSKGRTEGIVVLESTAPDSLNQSAVRLISDMRCKPSKEWVANGGLERRIKMNVIFQYRGQESAKPLDPEADITTIVTDPLQIP